MSSQFRVLHVGCGGMSGAWLEAAAQFPRELRIAGLVDLDPARAEARAREFQLSDCWIGDDVGAGLEAVTPEIVFDCTVPAAHEAVTLAALEAGANVLGEKPIAESMEAARRMVAAAEERGLLYAVTQSRRMTSGLRTVRRAVASGLIGEVHSLNADFFIGAHFGGFRDEMEHVLLLDMAIHSFDQARCMSGLDPRTVYCHEWNPPGSWYRHGANAVAVFEMDGRVVFNYRGSWCAEGVNTSWNCHWRIVGSQGTLLWDGEEEVRAFSTSPAEGLLWPVRELPVEAVELPTEERGHAGNMKDFLRALKEGGRPETAGRDNLKSLSMVFAAVASAESGRKVSIVV